MSDLVGNPEDQFSHIGAFIIVISMIKMDLLIWMSKKMYICKHIFSIILSHGSVETRAVTPASVEMRPQNKTVYVYMQKE